MEEKLDLFLKELAELTEKYGIDRCPLVNEHGCLIISDENVLDLIIRQQAEIERLKDLLKYEEAKYDRCAKQFYKAGVKEFVERLKEKQRTFIGDGYAYEFIPSIEIDVLLAEWQVSSDEKEKIYV